MTVISRDQNGVPVSEITRLYAEKRYNELMWLGCGGPSELQHYLKVGRSTSASGWSRFRLQTEGETLRRYRISSWPLQLCITDLSPTIPRRVDQAQEAARVRRGIRLTRL